MAEGEPVHPQRSAAELRARLIGNSLEHDQEDIEFWRAASEQIRAKTLYEILARGERIRKSSPFIRYEPNRLILRKGQVIIQSRE